MIEQLKNAVKPAERDPVRLVVGLNRVDEIVHEGWNEGLNLPTDEAARQIDRKCADVVRLLSRVTRLQPDHIEYYSALKRYRLHELLNRVIRHCYAGFKFTDVEPLPFEAVDGVSDEARDFVRQERRRRLGHPEERAPAREKLFAELSKFLSASELRLLESKFSAEMRKPPKIAVLGQSGVGKTTTVNALFATEWRTSAVGVGTHDAQGKRVALPSGGVVDVVDLPGYGRSISEDERYDAIYRKVLPGCDLVLLVIQADRGDLADDQEMVVRIMSWLKGAPVR
ncbi:GTPase [Streptomyces sp. NPDC055099]